MKNSKSAPTVGSEPVLFHQAGRCSLGALITSLRLDQPFYACRLAEGDNENADFLELNALGEVPLLFIDGEIITENVAILQHLGHRDLEKGLTFPAGSAAYDQLNRALGFLASDFHRSFGPTFHAAELHPNKEVQAEIKRRVIAGPLKDVIRHADRHLFDPKSASPFLFDRPMIVDDYLFAMARWAENFYDVAREFPNLRRFQTAMAEDPFVRYALEIEKGKHAEGKGNYLGNVDFAAFIAEAAARKIARKESDAAEGALPGLATAPNARTTGKENRA